MKKFYDIILNSRSCRTIKPLKRFEIKNHFQKQMADFLLIDQYQKMTATFERALKCKFNSLFQDKALNAHMRPSYSATIFLEKATLVFYHFPTDEERMQFLIINFLINPQLVIRLLNFICLQLYQCQKFGIQFPFWDCRVPRSVRTSILLLKCVQICYRGQIRNAIFPNDTENLLGISPNRCLPRTLSGTNATALFYCVRV